MNIRLNTLANLVEELIGIARSNQSRIRRLEKHKDIFEGMSAEMVLKMIEDFNK